MSDKEGSGSAILRPIAQIIEYYPRCIRLIWDAAKLSAILAVGTNMLSAVVPAAQVWITKIVIDNVVSAVGNGDGAAVDWIALLIPVAGVFSVWVLGALCGAAANGLIEKVGYLVRNHSEYLILRKAAQLDIAFFEDSAFFDEMEKARSESSYRSLQPRRLVPDNHFFIDWTHSYVGRAALSTLGSTNNIARHCGPAGDRRRSLRWQALLIGRSNGQ